MVRKVLHISLLILVSSFCIIGSAQQETSGHDTIITDTVTKEVLLPLRQRVADEIKRNIEQFNADKITARQNEVLDNIMRVSQKANDYFEKGIDTAGIASELEYLLRLYDVAGDGIFKNKGSTQTDRNLATSSTLLKKLRNRTELAKQKLDSYLKSMVGFRNQIDSLASDSILLELPSDSISLIHLISKITRVTSEMRPADSLLKKAIQKVQLLQTRLNFVSIRMEDGIEQIDNYRDALSSSLSDREIPNLWAPVAFRRPFGEIYHLSKEKATLVFSFYSKENSGRIVFLLLLITGLTLFLRKLKKKLLAVPSSPGPQEEYLVLRYPLLSAILIVLCVFQFIFPIPPFGFSIVLWTISVVSLTFIFRNFVTKYWRSAWIILMLMFFLAAAVNLTLQASRIERWGMFLLSLMGVLLGVVFVISRRQNELKERGVRIFIGFFILMELLSAVANVYGRFNISKSLLTSGIFGLVNGILFFWVIRLTNEMLTIAARTYQTANRKTLYVNFERVGKRGPFVFYYFLVVGWVILFGRSFYFFRKLGGQFTDYLLMERTVGKTTFNIQSILLFFLILLMSGIISSIVSFFASSDQGVAGSGERTRGIGSWLLLIRISIITIGVLVAFAAAGVPMDRLAVILGALSVGIGFGLQALINNLVSGLILVFEKPIKVGDVVEFGGQSGTMKSMGFRSSIITTWDGADVIIPNGNLLNGQLINWTRGNSRRRVEIGTKLAHGIDLEKIKKLVLGLLAADKRILIYPPPSVLIKDFDSSSVDIRILFWIEHFRTWTQIKSDAIEAIDEALKKEGQQNSLPRQDVNAPGSVNEMKKKDDPDIFPAM